ncbi:MAG TPA: hypothetical protein VFI27_09995 [candidate division Zixibacteria bacterium]|nr:hypothetical protein [candidate division Zixibacteria bacterium]
MEKSDELRESLKETDWAWIAGMVDGEGCISLQRGYTKQWVWYKPRLAVTNTDQAAMEFIAKALGANTRKRKPVRPHYRPIVDVEVGSRKTLLSILPKLIPYLRIKRRQAELLLRTVRLPRGSSDEKCAVWMEFDRLITECGQKRAEQTIRRGNPEPSQRMK